MKKSFILLVVIAVSFVGCGSSSKSVAVKKVQTKKVAKPKNTKPKWIENPDLDGNIGAVGIVKLMENKKKQLYIAKKLATASLQERKRVEIDSQMKLSSGKNGDESSSVIKQTSSHYNAYDIIQKGEFSDKENYYIWMVVKK